MNAAYSKRLSSVRMNGAKLNPLTAISARIVDSPVHQLPVDFADRFALAVTKLLRLIADTFFAKRYGHRTIVFETVAAAPGMVGATIQHLTSLRRMVDDAGWIRTLMEEAENERMHLMTFIEVAQPTQFERAVVMFAQWISTSDAFCSIWFQRARRIVWSAISRKKR